MPIVELDPVQTAFLETHLHSDLPDREEGDDIAFALDTESVDIADLWLIARTSADAAISTLKAELEKSDDPNLQRIAQFGLMDLTGGNHSQIMAAIIGYNTASPDDRPKRAATLDKALSDLEEHLASSDLVALVEDNAWDLPVSIREPLGRAISAIKNKLAA